MSAGAVEFTGKRCPDCSSPISRFKDGGTSGLFVDHEPSCPRWVARCAEHGVTAITHKEQHGRTIVAVIEMGNGGHG